MSGAVCTHFFVYKHFDGIQTSEVEFEPHPVCLLRFASTMYIFLYILTK